ncbi:hypothetical protein, variant 1 [Blastomyces dermatitidis ER-3]|nr:uncharacterized protein BDCG_00921 [Blastomyces dermatitidis ER-3]XP_045279357.1 hypothetical protein, variant 1 [Blastomyces dermatitidis ER-3]OAS99628.1 hypothetical protein BDCG_00921 [Blastomyces dermatitidis ER-3]OAS99629.1 hypothetical protein, variant 1 [Blastomyces dermatitidis ER-3]
MIPALAFILAVISSAIGTSPRIPIDNTAAPFSKRAMDELSTSLSVTIGLPCTNSVLNPADPLELTVSVHNNNPNQAVTLLKWNTPLDPQANVLGVFEVREAECGTPVDSLVAKISRKLPPTPEDLVEIPANGVKEVQVTLRPMGFSAGHQYKISAKGRWQALWAAGLDDVIATDSVNMACATSGNFESNVVMVSFK